MCPNPSVCFPYFAKCTPRMLPVYNIFVQLWPNILRWLATDISCRCCITTIVTAVGGASFRLSATLRCFENHNEEWVLFLYNFADVFENHEESGSQLQISILSNYKPFLAKTMLGQKEVLTLRLNVTHWLALWKGFSTFDTWQWKFTAENFRISESTLNSFAYLGISTIMSAI